MSTPSLPPPSRKKKKTSEETQDIDAQLQQHINSTGELLEQALQSQAREDGDSHFGRVVIDKLREIPEGYPKDKLKIDILQMILQTKHNVSSTSTGPSNEMSFRHLLEAQYES